MVAVERVARASKTLGGDFRAGCEGRAVGTMEIAQDILAAAATLRGAEYVRRSGIRAIGESLGGGDVLAALGTVRAGAAAPFARAIVYYPVCVGIVPWRALTPVLMLLGALDDITPPAMCRT